MERNPLRWGLMPPSLADFLTESLSISDNSPVDNIVLSLLLSHQNVRSAVVGHLSGGPGVKRETAGVSLFCYDLSTFVKKCSR